MPSLAATPLGPETRPWASRYLIAIARAVKVEHVGYPHPVFPRSFRCSAIADRSASLIGELVDLEGFDFRLEGLAGNAELGSRSCRTGDPSVGLGQRGFDHGLLALGERGYLVRLPLRRLVRLSRKP